MMTKAKMNAALKKAGCTKIKEFWRNVDADGTDHWKHGINAAFLFRKTPEGVYYWSSVERAIREKAYLVSELGESVPGYPVLRAGNNLIVGCQTLTPKHQKNLFRLLAEQLGYEIED